MSSKQRPASQSKKVSGFSEERLHRFAPAVDVSETSEHFFVRVNLPGVKPDKINLKIHGQTLLLEGVKPRPKLDGEETYLLLERSFGSFTRSVSFPLPIVEEKTEATFSQGVLTVSLPKTKKRKRVSIKTEQGEKE